MSSKNEKRVHGSAAAGAGDVGSVDDGDYLGPCPSCAADLRVGYATHPRTGCPARVITHPMPFCTYYGETDPTTIERDVHRAREKGERA
jgi:hypothetical protein